MASLHRLPVQMLGDLVSPRALERILQEAAQARGSTLELLDIATLEDILKKEVFKRLQLSVPAPLAKKRVSEVLGELIKATQERLLPAQGSQIPALEEAARRFSLYFDWPETQRLRGVLTVARQEEKDGRDVGDLVREAQNLIDAMDRRLQEGLIEQGQDLAELRAAFERVQGMGGKDVRRLDTLIGQIDEAQKQGTLLPGEVERARTITFNLRKLLESSVVQTVPSDQAVIPTSATILDPDAQARVLALEQEHAAQQLNLTEREYTPLLQGRADLREQHDRLRALHAQGQLTAELVEDWRTQLKVERERTLGEQRAQLARLEDALAQATATADMRIALDSARHLLDSGSLATDELQELAGMQAALAAGVNAAQQLETQRELLDIERSARNVPGASEELAPLITQARAALAQGAGVDITDLWTRLERRMGAAAQEREDFDARADRVVREYDMVRGLAGETTQRLGRMADTLRAQRRLGRMSAQARERYEQTLHDAEALLAEAHAEYRAAQEVTATFGQDALSGLLDVFDFQESSILDTDPGPAIAARTDPFGFASAPPSPAQPSPAVSNPAASDPAIPAASAASLFDTLLSGGAAPVTTPTPTTPDHTPAPSSAFSFTGTAPAEPVETWLFVQGQIQHGAHTLAAQGMGALLQQASALGLHRLDMGDASHVWSARSSTPGEWRVGRALNWTDLDEQVGPWLDTGES
ncbi:MULTISPECIES: hypothetical protein [Deinococcus]|uniref:Uncharacterized protein n=1 Tax=Deinococcus soli (ex Cha et al. 2016) TaxID=1309411 RepID=A0A0F7JR49_9DEIO|nr:MULTISPECIES: hypothetical protein [Deinococcus]AKH17040.1 hypothetical protein SY84_08190 [Deinococcus soli (ex Cha et al. 2016)]MDK2014527.1 hypothetical protein [Deinococcus sp. 43]